MLTCTCMKVDCWYGLLYRDGTTDVTRTVHFGLLYRDGTTDVTRTVHFGMPTDRQKVDMHGHVTTCYLGHASATLYRSVSLVSSRGTLLSVLLSSQTRRKVCSVISFDHR